MPANQVNTNDQSIFKSESINLIHSSFKQNDAESKKSTARFEFSISADVYTDFIVSKLTVKLRNQIALENHQTIVQSFECCFAGYFSTSPTAPEDARINFAKINSLSIIWPYAREYISDTLRRTGIPFPILPIINPQVVAEKLDQEDLVHIQMYDHSFKDPA